MRVKVALRCVLLLISLFALRRVYTLYENYIVLGLNNLQVSVLGESSKTKTARVTLNKKCTGLGILENSKKKYLSVLEGKGERDFFFMLSNDERIKFYLNQVRYC